MRASLAPARQESHCQANLVFQDSRQDLSKTAKRLAQPVRLPCLNARTLANKIQTGIHETRASHNSRVWRAAKEIDTLHVNRNFPAKRQAMLRTSVLKSATEHRKVPRKFGGGREHPTCRRYPTNLMKAHLIVGKKQIQQKSKPIQTCTKIVRLTLRDERVPSMLL